jgi:hypothetical protein
MAITLSEHQLCVGIRSPAVLARLLGGEIRSPTPPDTPRSPQRPWFIGSVSRYFQKGRDPALAIAELEGRANRSKRREQIASQIIMARAMLDRFLTLDIGEPDPVRYFPAPMAADILGWHVRLGHDLVYDTPQGPRLRQLLTDAAIRRGEHLRLFAVASLLHFEATNPPLRLTTVEVLQLRVNKRMLWPRSLLLRLVPELRGRLDQVAAALADDAA